MHPEARAFTRGQAATCLPRAALVDLGARDFNGGVRDLFPDAASYVGVDLAPGAGVDVVADAPPTGAQAGEPPPETVVCCEVLEHAPGRGDRAQCLGPAGPRGPLRLTRVSMLASSQAVHECTWTAPGRWGRGRLHPLADATPGRASSRRCSSTPRTSPSAGQPCTSSWLMLSKLVTSIRSAERSAVHAVNVKTREAAVVALVEMYRLRRRRGR